jgi:hypothetical protein
MTLVDCPPAVWPAHWCSSRSCAEPPASSPECDDSGRNKDAHSQHSLRVEELGAFGAPTHHHINQKEGVHNVHTLGFGFGCTGV